MNTYNEADQYCFWYSPSNLDEQHVEYNEDGEVENVILEFHTKTSCGQHYITETNNNNKNSIAPDICLDCGRPVVFVEEDDKNVPR